jgi:hypothetical protein
MDIILNAGSFEYNEELCKTNELGKILIIKIIKC